MKLSKTLMTGAALAALALCIPVNAQAARKKADASPSPAASASPSAAMAPAAPPAANTKMRAIPLRGMIASVDEKAKTFTIAGKEKSRTFKITTTTVITKAGAAATMKDVVANEEVRGSYYKMADGSLEAKSVKVGPLTEAEKAEKEAKKEKRVEKKAEKEKAAASASPSATPKP